MKSKRFSFFALFLFAIITLVSAGPGEGYGGMPGFGMAPPATATPTIPTMPTSSTPTGGAGGFGGFPLGAPPGAGTVPEAFQLPAISPDFFRIPEGFFAPLPGMPEGFGGTPGAGLPTLPTGMPGFGSTSGTPAGSTGGMQIPGLPPLPTFEELLQMLPAYGGTGAAPGATPGYGMPTGYGMPGAMPGGFGMPAGYAMPGGYGMPGAMTGGYGMPGAMPATTTPATTTPGLEQYSYQTPNGIASGFSERQQMAEVNGRPVTP